ncbi:MAG: hypothetical protein K2W88_17110 [Pararheinheimera sp.]|nr:hypothetical protein [Rheinheimera sp.]
MVETGWPKLDYFLQHSPDAETELLYDNPFQLLVAVILSAQCTDKRVNMTTPAIFEKYPDAETMSKASVEELFKLIKSISLVSHYIFRKYN